MFYIITYATHSERYFELLKQSCPDIIVLGYGEKWNGFNDKVKATINFCKSKQKDDIICFVDGFDSVVLTSKEEILEKYKSFDVPLVFSSGASSSSIFVKYTQDKLFGKCKHKRLNSGLFMGTSKSIIDFWKDIQEKEDDQTYATKQCKKIDYMTIDNEHKLFYNYSSADTINIKNNSLFVNSSKLSTSIISCPGNNNINSILSQLKYTNLPEIKYDFKYRLSTYATAFIKEFIIALLIVGIFIYFKNIAYSIIISLLLFFSFIEYELYIKHMDISKTNKLLYLILDAIHISVTLFILWIIINVDCSIQKLLLINIFYFIIIACFFYFKRCFITIISNKLLNNENNTWNSPNDRISYFFVMDKPYEKIITDNKKISNLWMNGNIVTISAIILFNMYCLWKISTGASCIKPTGFGIFKQVSNRKYIKKFK